MAASTLGTPQISQVLGRTGWKVSPVGFGTYRAQDRKALREALLNGCNLIDTSATYMDGGSERLIGEVLREIFSEGTLKREDLIVISKAGYVQGENLKLAQDRVTKGIPFPEMVEVGSDCWHCISPEFLKDQITRSLSRLKLERLDALLLHNPEYFLKTQADHGEYYRRIGEAFAYLETEVRDGRIQYYGISSNTFPDPREAPGYTSLEIVTELAEKLGSDHHFAVIQFPFNIYEPGALLEENNSGRTVIEYARAKNIGTLINRPLNALTAGRLVRLADFPSHDGVNIVGDFKEAMTRTTALEAQYSGKALVATQRVAWGHILRENFTQLSNVDTWKNVLARQIRPTLDEALDILSDVPEQRTWVQEYREASSQLFDAFTAYVENQASVESDRIAGILDHLCPELQSSQSLSQKVIRLYRSIPGIDCILVGMRQTQYVRDVMDLKAPIGYEAARHALIELTRGTATSEF